MIARIKGLKRKKDTAESSTAPKPVSKQLVLPVDATISYGGWQPHTALHMEEVYEFLSQGTSKLSLSSDKLFSLHQMLDLQSVAKEAGYLEYVRATTNNNIEIRYFEDGLFILESTSRNPELTTKILKTSHDNSFIPALRYLFSQDVPMPGLQNHTLTNHPVVVALTSTRPREFEVDPAFGA